MGSIVEIQRGFRCIESPWAALNLNPTESTLLILSVSAGYNKSRKELVLQLPALCHDGHLGTGGMHNRCEHQECRAVVAVTNCLCNLQGIVHPL